MAKIDFDALRAEVEAKFPDEPKEPKKRGRPAKSAPEPAPKAQDAPDQQAESLADRMIFAAFDKVVGKVDDFDRMSVCWRKALEVIEQQVREMAYTAQKHPDTEEHLAVIAAIVAYDELRA